MICRACKKEIRDDSVFCKYCGRDVQKDAERAFCTSCGNKINDDSNFCSNCGAKIYPDTEEANTSNTYKANTAVKEVSKAGSDVINKIETKITKKNALIAVAVVIAVSAIFGFMTHNKKSVSETNSGSKTVIADTSTESSKTGSKSETVINDTSTESGETGSKSETVIDDTSTESSKTGDKNKTDSDNKAVNVNGIYYKLNDTKLVISGNGELDKKTIDSFSKKFDSVVFESGSIDIPDDAFSGFSNIKNVELKNTVNRIGARAFKGCGFNYITIGKSVSEINEDAFADCAISDVYINNSKIRSSLNARTDCGRLVENASNINIWFGTDTGGSDEFSFREETWGQYLKSFESYVELMQTAMTKETLAGKYYAVWSNYGGSGFVPFHTDTGISGDLEYDVDEYDDKTNTLKLLEITN